MCDSKFKRYLKDDETFAAINISSFRQNKIAHDIFKNQLIEQRLNLFQANFNLENNLFGTQIAILIDKTQNPDRVDEIVRSELFTPAIDFLRNERQYIFPSAGGSAGPECIRAGIDPAASNNICWLCARQIPNVTPQDIRNDLRTANFKFECEHVLPYLLGAFLLKLSTPETHQIRDYQPIINLEYKPSHHICNQFKLQGTFIKYNIATAKFELNQEQIDAFVHNLFNSCGPDNSQEYEFEYFINTPVYTGERPNIDSAKASIINTLTPILDFLNKPNKIRITNGQMSLVQGLIASSFIRSCIVKPELVENIQTILSNNLPIPQKLIKEPSITMQDTPSISASTLLPVLEKLFSIVSLDNGVGQQHTSQFGKNKKYKMKLNIKKIKKNCFGALTREQLNKLKVYILVPFIQTLAFNIDFQYLVYSFSIYHLKINKIIPNTPLTLDNIQTVSLNIYNHPNFKDLIIIPTKYGYTNFSSMVIDYPEFLMQYEVNILKIIAEKFTWFYNNFYAQLYTV